MWFNVQNINGGENFWVIQSKWCVGDVNGDVPGVWVLIAVTPERSDGSWSLCRWSLKSVLLGERNA